ncbi:hypothetical protein PENTCL1PPCAC_29507 [Pristionchus entomophagus]|uniref:Uncharacterized protein n=1 Tax=Pristionchus entomophagus TaxID=358040 RepID=A0AAV5ULZ4_9BILA|nr:hypothetical protein PENTCL1PPCAC_29507 [Pristionchus entomophagus]
MADYQLWRPTLLYMPPWTRTYTPYRYRRSYDLCDDYFNDSYNFIPASFYRPGYKAHWCDYDYIYPDHGIRSYLRTRYHTLPHRF